MSTCFFPTSRYWYGQTSSSRMLPQALSPPKWFITTFGSPTVRCSISRRPLVKSHLWQPAWLTPLFLFVDCQVKNSPLKNLVR